MLEKPACQVESELHTYNAFLVTVAEFRYKLFDNLTPWQFISKFFSGGRGVKKCTVKSYFFCLYKVTLWPVLKNKLGIAPLILFLAKMVLLTYPQEQITTFSTFFHVIQVFSSLKRALVE